MNDASGNAALVDCVKGAVLCRFDLSFGPVPVISYPLDFMSAEQSNKIAMRSMLRLSAAEGKTTVTLSTFDEMNIMGLGILGRLPNVGFYSLVVYFDANVPECISDSIEKVESLLVSMNSRISQQDAALKDFVKQVFMEIQELIEAISSAPNLIELGWSKELENAIGKVTDQVEGVVNDYQKLDLLLHRQFADNAIEIVRNLSLLSIKHNRHLVARSLVDLLMRLEKIRYQKTV